MQNFQNEMDEFKNHSAGKEFIHRLFPKRIRCPDRWHDPKISAFALFGHALALDTFFTDNSSRRSSAQSALACNVFIKSGSPVYLVEGDCLNALMRTSVPDDIKLSDLQWPHDGFMLTFPKGSLFGDDSSDNEVTHAIVSRANGLFYIHANLLSTSTYSFGADIAGFSLQETFAKSIDIHRTDPSGKTITVGVGVDDFGPEDADTDSLRRITMVCLSALMLMNAVPEEILYGGNEKRVKRGKSDQRPWIDPHLLGRTFSSPRKLRITRAPSHIDSTSDKISEHWRRGHWRNQPFGPKDLQKTKLTWIRPTHINKPD